VKNSLEDMSRFSNSLPPSTPIAIESSSAWYWSYKLLSERHVVSLSNPVENKAIASAKVNEDRQSRFYNAGNAFEGRISCGIVRASKGDHRPKGVSQAYTELTWSERGPR